jgi:hypothetical protein
MSTEDKNLIVSREDGVQLLKKWLDDDIPVSLRILAPGLSASLGGFMSAVDGPSFTMAHLTQTGEMVGEITVEFSNVTHWSYKDVREATDAARELFAGRVAGTLQLILNNGMECAIYEIVEPGR